MSKIYFALDMVFRGSTIKHHLQIKAFNFAQFIERVGRKDLFSTNSRSNRFEV